MSPTLILIRHAHIPDPPLSELGFQQCVDLQTQLQGFDLAQQVELIIVSPMRRTLQTALKGLGWLIDRGVQVQLRGEWQENSDKPCDTGTPTHTLSKEFPTLDFGTVFPEYPAKTGRWAFSDAAIEQRAEDCRNWLRNRPEKIIAVVSHSGFLRVGVSHKHYANADYRVFGFVAGGGSELLEWQLTEAKGGGMGKSDQPRASPAPIEDEVKGPGEVVAERSSR